ncbi:GNAT family N-acetyltransferase [Clostridium sp.]|uniref:GNAT family N-acetyltransferase n=1 Tax=Clostridium sp. TaxID=1506 RepID=UPI0034646CA8
MIKYINSLENISETNLEGFFVDWPNPPSPEKHLQLLNKSDYFWLAIDETTNDVVGFITAISDKTLSAYIPLLEVLPPYKGKGIGSHLVKLMLETLKDFYMIDLMCDNNIVDFYKKFSMIKSQGMIMRNYNKQSGL